MRRILRLPVEAPVIGLMPLESALDALILYMVIVRQFAEKVEVRTVVPCRGRLLAVCYCPTSPASARKRRAGQQLP